MKKFIPLSVALFAVLAITGCSTQETSSIQTSSNDSVQETSSLSSSESIDSSEVLSQDTVIVSETSSFVPTILENELFISEFYNINYKNNVYEEDNSNNNKAIELYNPTDASLDLSKYSLKLYSNGQTESDKIISLSGTLEAKTCYTVVHEYANDALKRHADVLDKVFIGPKSAVGLYKENTLIDVFGVIGASYGSNLDFVINGIEGATDIHNVVRVNGKRAHNVFTETEWEVRFDSDKSTLGIHEDDTKQKGETVTFDGTKAKEALNELVTTYYPDDGSITVTNKVTLITEYKGFHFSYSFEYTGGAVNQDGTINKDASNLSNNFYITIIINVLDEEGNVFDTTYGAVTYVVA